MFRKTFALLVLLVLAATVRAEINFTPSLKEYVSQGINYQSLSFKEDKSIISIELPSHWSYRGETARLQLLPAGNDFGEGVFQAVPLVAPQPFDEAVKKNLEGQVLSTLPTGSQSIEVIKREENAVILEQNPGYEIVVSYQTLGRVFQRSVVFVNYSDKQLIFRFTAPKSDFAALSRAFRRSILSWERATPKSTGPD